MSSYDLLLASLAHSKKPQQAVEGEGVRGGEVEKGAVCASGEEVETEGEGEGEGETCGEGEGEGDDDESDRETEAAADEEEAGSREREDTGEVRENGAIMGDSVSSPSAVILYIYST